MRRATPSPATYLELEAEEPTARDLAFFDEQTVRLDFDRPKLSAEAKLVIGYLTMEENDLFGHLSIEEQQQIAAVLRR